MRWPCSHTLVQGEYFFSAIKWSSETNLLTHKAEDGLAEADDPEDELEDEEDEGAEALGDEELKEGFLWEDIWLCGCQLTLRMPREKMIWRILQEEALSQKNRKKAPQKKKKFHWVQMRENKN